MAKLTKTLQLCEGEKKLSEEQLEVSTRRLDELSSGGGGEAQPMGQLLRDNFSLKKEVSQPRSEYVTMIGAVSEFLMGQANNINCSFQHRWVIWAI